MRLAAKVAAGIFVPLAAALALMAYMNYDRFAKTYREVSQSRAAAVLLDAQEAVESAITLGLSASSMTSLQGTLSRYVANDDGIQGLAVLDAGGGIALASEEIRLEGLDLSKAWTVPDLGPLPARAAGTAAVVIPVRDAQGVRVGTLLAIYSTAADDAALAGVRQILALIGAGVAAACAAAALAVAAIVLRPVAAQFGSMTQRLAEIRKRRNQPDYNHELASIVLEKPGAAS